MTLSKCQKTETPEAEHKLKCFTECYVKPKQHLNSKITCFSVITHLFNAICFGHIMCTVKNSFNVDFTTLNENNFILVMIDVKLAKNVTKM